MSNGIQTAASPVAPATPADRLKNCIKILNGLKPAPEAKADVQFLFNELLDLMALAQTLSPAQVPNTTSGQVQQQQPTTENTTVAKG